MITKTQYIKGPDGEILDTITHIYSEHGHFEKNGRKAGCHISFGPTVNVSDFTEVVDEGVINEFAYDVSDIVLTQEELDERNSVYEEPDTDGEDDDNDEGRHS